MTAPRSADLTVADEDLQQHPVEVGLVSMVALSVSISATTSPAVDGVADGLQPARDGAALHRVGEPRHHELLGHQSTPHSCRSPRTAASIFSSSGIAASSSGFA